jgi:hypothetical protein
MTPLFTIYPEKIYYRRRITRISKKTLLFLWSHGLQTTRIIMESNDFLRALEMSFRKPVHQMAKVHHLETACSTFHCFNGEIDR